MHLHKTESKENSIVYFAYTYRLKFCFIIVLCADTNSTIAVAVEARVNPALPAMAVVEFKAKWSNLYPLTVYSKIFIIYRLFRKLKTFSFSVVRNG